jgi:hypothetical protein
MGIDENSDDGDSDFARRALGNFVWLDASEILDAEKG